MDENMSLLDSPAKKCSAGGWGWTPYFHYLELNIDPLNTAAVW